MATAINLMIIILSGVIFDNGVDYIIDGRYNYTN